MASSGGVADVAFVFFSWLALPLASSRLNLRRRGVVAHVSRGEIFYGEFRDLFTEIVVMLCDKASPLAAKGMAYGESGIASVAVMGEVGWI